MAYRDFVDPTGVTWKVWDTYPPSAANVRPEFAQGWLSFQSAGERRRLQPVPPGWEDAPDDELRRWLEAAPPVRTGELDRYRGPGGGDPEPGPAAGDAPGDDSWQRTRAVVERARRVIRLLNSAIHREGGEHDREG